MKSASRSQLLARVAMASLVLGVAQGLIVPVAMAQDDAPAGTGASNDDGAVITVTGSRIAQRDFSSDSPIVTVGSEALTNSADTAIERNLSKLPQFLPGDDQFNSASSFQSTATSSPGAATVNLRGLGSNRNLVLVDGRRAQPANASNAIDINTIPAAAVDRVEIISGGAAATYGSDAVSGVVNFILKDSLEGVFLDAKYGQSFRGYGEDYTLSGLVAGTFADSRGHALVNISYSNRQGVLARDIPFLRERFTDPTHLPGFGEVLIADVGGANGFAQSALDSVFGPGVVSASFGNIAINQASTVAGSSVYHTSTGAGYVDNGIEIDGLPLIRSTNAGLQYNNLALQASLPLKRYSAFGKAAYDVTDDITVYAQANFAKTHSRAVIGTNTATFPWGLTVPRDADHPVPDNLAILLDNRTFFGSPVAPGTPFTVNLELEGLIGPRGQISDSETFQVLGGLGGNLPISDWTFDVYGSHGETSTIFQITGIANLLALQTLLNAPNYGAGYTDTRPFIGSATCTSGVNPFLNAPISQDCVDIIRAPITNVTTLSQDIAEATIQGKAADLPAGELRFALGASYREVNFAYRPDPLMQQSNINSAAIGIFNTSPTSGTTKVKEVFGEIYAPILRDVPLIQELSLNLGFRYSDYSAATVGGVWTWKALGDWSVNDWLRVRGGFQRATRAPNAAELFQGGTTVAAAGGNGGDPCETGFGAPAWADHSNAALNELCSAQTGGNVPASVFQAGIGTGIAFNVENQSGNPNVGAERADTWTAGVVIRSPFASGAMRNVSLTVDYYNISIEDAIGGLSSKTVFEQCFNQSGSNPSYDPSNQYCQMIDRNPFSGLVNFAQGVINTTYVNLPGVKTAGVDVALNWAWDLEDVGAPGAFSLNVAGNWVDKYKVSTAPGTPFTDQVGISGGPTLGGSSVIPEWRTTTTVGYSIGPVSSTLQWRHLPSIQPADVNGLPARPTGSYDIFDLAAQIDLNDTFTISLGMNNLFDARPKLTQRTAASEALGATFADLYDILGRRFFIGASAEF